MRYDAIYPGYTEGSDAQAIGGDHAAWRVRDHLTFGSDATSSGLQRYRARVIAINASMSVQEVESAVDRLESLGICRVSQDRAWVWVYKKAECQYAKSRPGTMQQRMVSLWLDVADCKNDELRIAFVMQEHERFRLDATATAAGSGRGADSALGSLVMERDLNKNNDLSPKRAEPRSNAQSRAEARLITPHNNTQHNNTTRATPPRSVPVASLPMREKDPEPIEEDVDDAPGLPLELEPPTERGPSNADISAIWEKSTGFKNKSKPLYSRARALLANGYTTEDLSLAAECCAKGPNSAWMLGANAKGKVYVRPETVWGDEKFPTYLAEAKVWSRAQSPQSNTYTPSKTRPINKWFPDRALYGQVLTLEDIHAGIETSTKRLANGPNARSEMELRQYRLMIEAIERGEEVVI